MPWNPYQFWRRSYRIMDKILCNLPRSYRILHNLTRSYRILGKIPRNPCQFQTRCYRILEKILNYSTALCKMLNCGIKQERTGSQDPRQNAIKSLLILVKMLWDIRYRRGNIACAEICQWGPLLIEVIWRRHQQREAPHRLDCQRTWVLFPARNSSNGMTVWQA